MDSAKYWRDPSENFLNRILAILSYELMNRLQMPQTFQKF